MQTVLKSYEKITKNIPALIEKSGLRDGFIAEKIGMKHSNFSVKKMRGNWKFDEVNKIINLMTEPNEDVDDLLLLFEMEARKDEDVITDEEFKRLKNAAII